MSKDRGYAWVVCATSFLVQVVIGGFMYTSGIFYIMFKNGIDASDSALSLITSLNIGIMFIVCPAVGMLSDRYGERCIAVLGAFLSTVGLAASAFTTQVYQLYIFYSIFAGVGMGMNYNPCISILSKYFNRHRRTACACAMCGLGAGSFIIPPLLKALEEYYGWRGAILMIAGINSQNIVLCCIFRPVEEQEEEHGDVDAEIEVVKEVMVENVGKVSLNETGISTDLGNEKGLGLRLRNVNNFHSSSRSINKNSAHIKSLCTSHTDMGAFYRSSSDVNNLYQSSSDVNQLNKCSIGAKGSNKGSSHMRPIYKSSSHLYMSSADVKTIIYNSSSNIKHLSNSSSAMKSLEKSPTDVKDLYLNSTGIDSKTSSYVKDIPKSPSDIPDHRNSASDMKGLSKSFSELEIYTEDPKSSETLAGLLLSLFTITPFLCIILFTFIVQFTIAFVYTHFGNYVLTLGYSSSDVVGLYMAMGITSTLCRPLMGFLAQATNANAAAFILITNVANGILTAALPLTTNLGLMYVYIIMFSVLLTPYNILSSSFVMESVPAAQASTGFGLLCFFCTPGSVLGAPLAAWFYGSTNIYDYSFYLAGGLMVMAGLTMFPPAYTVYKNRRAENARNSGN